MTKTTRDLRSAAHALRTAANALEETVTALRALSDDLNEPDPEPAPEPVWPTAELLWHDGEAWTRDEAGDYDSANDAWGKRHMNSETADIREGARCFAREAVPVTLVPTEAWEAWLKAVGTTLAEVEHIDGDLIDAVDSLAQEVAR